MHTLHTRMLSMKAFIHKMVLGMVFGLTVWFFGCATSANANCDLPLSAKLTLYQQALLDEAITPTLTKSTVTQVKLANREVLALLASHYSTAFPTGSKLCFNLTDGTVTVHNQNNSLLLTVETSVLMLDVKQPILVTEESLTTLINDDEIAFWRTRDANTYCNIIPVDSESGPTTQTICGGSFSMGSYAFITTLEFHSSSRIDILAMGQMNSAFSWALPSTATKITFNANIAGRGTLQDQLAIVSGTIAITGRQPLVMPPSEVEP